MQFLTARDIIATADATRDRWAVRQACASAVAAWRADHQPQQRTGRGTSVAQPGRAKRAPVAQRPAGWRQFGAV